MSSFNETISFASSFQGGTGVIGTTKGQLVNAKDSPCFKEVWIRNTHASLLLYIGDSRVSATLGKLLPPGEVIALQVRNTKEIWIVGSAADTAYSWLGY